MCGSGPVESGRPGEVSRAFVCGEIHHAPPIELSAASALYFMGVALSRRVLISVALFDIFTASESAPRKHGPK